jgi:L-seryl-tRNA(Ser) seleniumtransferase
MADSESTASVFRPPSIEEIVSDPRYEQWVENLSRPLVTSLVRAAVEQVRKSPEANAQALDREVQAHLETWQKKSIKPVLNATGVLVHTNLGRAPVDQELWAKLISRLEGYAVLEFDLESGERGRRGTLAHRMLAELAGSAAGLAVNNCAAAVLLMLCAARGKEVLVSRGELVQIGGGFKIPEIMAQSGARLVEVGTTNRTSLQDYKQALTDHTGAILKVHRSNFEMSGFVEEVSSKSLRSICQERGILLLEDLGSGAVHDLSVYGLPRERTISDAVRDGVSVVCFSGDKLLGGPQAGLLAGNGDTISTLAQHPLYRALRPGKMTLAALEISLGAHLSGRAETELPLYRLLAANQDLLTERADIMAKDVSHDSMQVRPSHALTGGGTLPGANMPSVALVLQPRSAESVAAHLRQRKLPVIARVAEGEVWFDLKTVFPEQDAELTVAIKDVASL